MECACVCLCVCLGLCARLYVCVRLSESECVCVGVCARAFMCVTLKPMMKILRVSRTVRHTSVAMLASSRDWLVTSASEWL